jgi:hypothetical protein
VNEYTYPVECLPIENESTPENKLFEFLKYNNICSLTAILNESISKLCGLSTKYAKI